MSKRTYLSVSQELRGNDGQWAAFESKGHCVVLAGPGSGKTKTLTLKLARILAEDVQAPRGVACITYNNECARELETRLYRLGIEASDRCFIGTVHSFSLTQIVLPYAKTAKLGLPEEYRVATKAQMKAALEDAYRDVVGDQFNPQNVSLPMSVYRRTYLDRDAAVWKNTNPQLAALAERYEEELRKLGVIDFDDMPLLAVKALRENVWLQRAVMAKYPVIAVDEYQDLGLALHRMVMGLCFSAGIRLFAVGDADQSIYGFTGADPLLLERLSKRSDVEVVKLRLNYRCGSDIVRASSYALGEDRDYSAPAGARQGTIYFHPRTGNESAQADFVFSTLIPQITRRTPDLPMGEIAILYTAANVGNSVRDAAVRRGFETIRTDGNALYPRSSILLRWFELCAAWCCGGWRVGEPRFAQISGDGRNIFREALLTEESVVEFNRQLIDFLNNKRDPNVKLFDWLVSMTDSLILPLIKKSHTLAEEMENLVILAKKVRDGGERAGMTLAQFSGQGVAGNRINLSTLHSAKGREFQVVVLFGMDQGRIPWNNVGPNKVRESRRLFYVGFTRAKSEIHIVYSQHQPSPFVTEVQNRLTPI